MIIKLFEQYLEYSGLNTYWNVGDATIYFKDLLKYLDKQKVPIQSINPKKIENLLIKTKRDPKRIEYADLQYPIIISMKNGKYKSILDGHHRLVKALKYNLDKIKIKVLDIDSAPYEYKIIFDR